MLQHDVTPTQLNFVSRDKSVDVTGVLSRRATVLECLRHNYLSLRHVPMMRRHKPDLLLLDHKRARSIAFRTIAGTGDQLSNHALGI